MVKGFLKFKLFGGQHFWVVTFDRFKFVVVPKLVVESKFMVGQQFWGSTFKGVIFYFVLWIFGGSAVLRDYFVIGTNFLGVNFFEGVKFLTKGTRMSQLEYVVTRYRVGVGRVQPFPPWGRGCPGEEK